MVKEKRPLMVFLMETKLRAAKVELLRVRMGFGGVFVVDSVGHSGGLALFWREEVDVTIQNYSRRHINAVVKFGNCTYPWKFTGFYGHPEPGKRKEAWSLLKFLRSFSPEAWMCVGDFNEIAEDSEKFGNVPRALWQMVDFREALDYTQLRDLGFEVGKYTWLNKREGTHFIKERLDRALSNPGWLDYYQVVRVAVLAACTSDHAPLLISFQRNRPPKRSPRFRYNAVWGKQKVYKEVIKKEWRPKHPQPVSWKDVVANLEGCKKALISHNRINKCPTESAIAEKTEKLRLLQQDEGLPDLIELSHLQSEVDQLVEH
jgi:exonuclease III